MKSTHHQVDRGKPVITAIAASLSLAIGMGFGRFAFTGLYPLMVEEGIISVQSGALAASANYAGYLLGALLTAWINPAQARFYCILSVIMTIACMALLALVQTSSAVISLRLIAGVFSAITMVAASLWLLQNMAQTHHAPLLFAGVGVGIAISAELIAMGSHFGMDSEQIWFLLASLSLASFLVICPAFIGKSTRLSHPGNTHARPTSSGRGPVFDATLLVVLYGLAGFGYIITATYLPLIIKDSMATISPIHIWAAFGLGAAPSCYLWHALYLRLGTRNSLSLNLIIQSIGVALPAFSQNTLTSLMSAMLVGGTFMGTVTIAMSVARALENAVRPNLLAFMTAAYGVGQIIGPLAANELYTITHSFTTTLMTASAALMIATMLGRFICR